MRCSYLFCHAEATSRLTMPTVKPRSCLCAKHLAELLGSKNAKRAPLGAVVIETAAQVSTIRIREAEAV